MHNDACGNLPLHMPVVTAHSLPVNRNSYIDTHSHNGMLLQRSAITRLTQTPRETLDNSETQTGLWVFYFEAHSVKPSYEKPERYKDKLSQQHREGVLWFRLEAVPMFTRSLESSLLFPSGLSFVASKLWGWLHESSECVNLVTISQAEVSF